MAKPTIEEVLATVPVPMCAHGHPFRNPDICEECVASDEADPFFVLDLCEAAIRDAIYLDDGLDGAAGEVVLYAIRVAKEKQRSTEPTRPTEADNA